MRRGMERIERLEEALRGMKGGGPGREGPGREGPGREGMAPPDARRPDAEGAAREMEELRAGLRKREARIHELEGRVEELDRNLRRIKEEQRGRPEKKQE
jgi:hypothetical protein